MLIPDCLTLKHHSMSSDGEGRGLNLQHETRGESQTKQSSPCIWAPKQRLSVRGCVLEQPLLHRTMDVEPTTKLRSSHKVLLFSFEAGYPSVCWLVRLAYLTEMHLPLPPEYCCSRNEPPGQPLFIKLTCHKVRQNISVYLKRCYYSICGSHHRGKKKTQHSNFLLWSGREVRKSLLHKFMYYWFLNTMHGSLQTLHYFSKANWSLLLSKGIKNNFLIFFLPTHNQCVSIESGG